MALRVLLADESSTIKKVFQLALQDFAVEVQPVNMGLDVLAVAKKFKPDIVFADILLQKRNGYDVSSDLKHDQELNSIPVVLMWSGFMELDEDKFQVSQADGRLEKPFDVKTLRKVIHDLVPKTKTQKLSGFLSFPKMPEFIGDGSIKPSSSASATEQPTGPSEPEKNWNMDDFDPPPLEEKASPEEAFQAVPLPSKKEEAPEPIENPDDFLKEDEDDSRWQRQDISRFKMNQDLASLEEEEPVTYIDPNESEEVALEAEAELPAAEPDLDSSSEIRTLEFEGDPDSELEVEEAAASGMASNPAALKGLSEEKLEEIIRAQSKEVIEAVVWKIVPEIATQIVERELKRLLEERDQLKSL